jgi:hypothetical protein
VVVRAGIAVLAALHLWWGAWARLAPEHFFANFPGGGRRWTAAYPPYNEHLVTDLGTTFLTLAFLLAVAAVLDDRRVRATVLSAVTLFGALHLAFHADAPGGMGTADYGTSLAALIGGAVLPAVLLGLDQLRAGEGLTRRRTRFPPDRPS